MDVIALAQRLIQCPSITPHEGGALDVLEDVLESLGFTCHRLIFEGIHNLYARRGTQPPHLCFLGHTDVVPPGDEQAWQHPPFAGIIHQDKLCGRGAVDMKGAIAAFISALAVIPKDAFEGSISLLITGDEEGPALHGTKRVLEWLQARGEIIDYCLGGEPTSVNEVGDTLKIGRRGSLSGLLTVFGMQGHVAYPDTFDNPLPRLLETLQRLYQTVWDEGSAHFQPTRFEVTSVDVGNPTSNIVPDQAQARFNLRFNDHHTAASLQDRLKTLCQNSAGTFDLNFISTCDVFLTSNFRFVQKVQQAVQSVISKTVTLSTSGGTSDARFIYHLCPVVELGLRHHTAHQVDEHVALKDLEMLKRIYEGILGKIIVLKLEDELLNLFL